MKANSVFLRDIVGNYMNELGKADNKIVVVNADLSGTSRNKNFIETFPDRSFNVGIAEQNMVSFAAGLAYEDMKPYVFTMAPFLTMRACEQCRTDIAYAKLNVKMIGTYSGLSGGISGATHWAIEDCGIMSSIPNIVILEPCDEIQAISLLKNTIDSDRPIYFRLTCEKTKNIYNENEEFPLGGSKVVTAGTDGTILCSGVSVQFSVEAADLIKNNTGKSIRVVDMYSIKPIDKEAIINAAQTGKVIVVHDHNIYGGLGSIVSQIIAESGIRTKFKILGIPDEFLPMAHPSYLYQKLGYDSNGIYNEMLSMLNHDK